MEKILEPLEVRTQPCKQLVDAPLLTSLPVCVKAGKMTDNAARGVYFLGDLFSYSRHDSSVGIVLRLRD
jgi:hypothetical protein